MPTVQIEIKEARKRDDNTVSFLAVNGNDIIDRTIDRATIDNLDALAEWIINQNPDYTLLPNKNITLEITFHTESEPDENGNMLSYRVVDSVTVV